MRKEATQRVTLDIPRRLHKIMKAIAKKTRKSLRELGERAIEKTYQDPIGVQREKCKRLASELHHEKQILDDMEAEK